MKLPIRRPEWRELDPVLGTLIMLLIGLGIFFIASADASGGEGGLLSRLAFKQTLFAVVSGVAFLVVLFLDYQWLARQALGIYFVGLALLLLVLVIGRETGGGQRWIAIGGPFRLQPSELMKVALILVLARLLSIREQLKDVLGFTTPFLLTLLPMGLIILQPDLGTALVCLPVLFVMLVVAGARFQHLALACTLGAISAPLVFAFGLKPYQKERILALFQTSKVVLEEARWQLEQSILSIGSGGFFGKGYMQSTVIVPVRSTDFIYTVAGEEGGFLGGLTVIALFCLLSLYLLSVAATTKDPFGRLIATGACALVAFQSLTNIAMTVGLAPITGLTLPLVSYGGSSLLSTVILLALVMNVQMRRLRPFGADEEPPPKKARRKHSSPQHVVLPTEARGRGRN